MERAVADVLPPHDADEAWALAEALRPALHRLMRRLRREGPELDISPLQTLLLVSIVKRPGIGVVELAAEEKLRGPTISGHVKAMELAGLVERTPPDPRDRRRIGLIATEKGRDLLETIRRSRTDWLARRLAQLPAPARQAIRAAIAPLEEIGR